MKSKYILMSIIIVFVIISGIIYLKDQSRLAETIIITDSEEDRQSVDQEPEVEEETIFVHLCGAVNNSDVYEVAKDSRLYEVVAKSGGFSDEASKDSVNLARMVYDGERIYIPSLEEVETGNYNEDININNKVSINLATKEELMTLSGIGESKAEAIIKYRKEQGRFEKIEDIMLVEGIKETMFDKIKDKINL